MRPLLYRLRSAMRHRGRAVVATSMLVTAISGGILVLAAGAVRTASTPRRYVSAQGQQFDVQVWQDAGASRMDEVAGLDAVDEVASATFVFGALLPSGSNDEPQDAAVFAGDPGATGDRLVRGHLPRKADEFVATRSFVDGAGAEVGDRFTLVTVSGAQADAHGFDVAEPDGPTAAVTLVGVLDGPADLQDGLAAALFPPELLDTGDIGIASSFGAVQLRSGATVDDLRAQLDTLDGGGAFGLEPADLVPSTVRDAVSTQAEGLAVLAAIAGLAGVVVLGQVVGRQFRLDHDEEFVLRALGYGTRAVRADPLLPASLAVAAGAVGGATVAALASGLFPVGFVTRMEPSPGARIEPWVHVGGPVLIAATLLVWAAMAHRGSGRSRIPTGRSRADLVATIPDARIATAYSFAFGRRGTARTARFPALGLTFVVCLLGGAVLFGVNLDRLLDDPARHGEPFDYAMGQGGPIDDSVRAALVADEDVAALTLFGTVTASAGTTSIDVTGVDPVRGGIAPAVLDGRLPQGDDEIALGRVAGRQLHVGVGDELRLGGPDGTASFHVVGNVVTPSVGQANGVGEGGVVTVEGLHRINPDAVMDTVGFDLRPGAIGAVDRIATTTGMAVGHPNPTDTIINLGRVRAIPYLVAGVLGVLAALSLTHLLITSIRRRSRDLAVLRALGADRPWRRAVVRWHGLLTTASVLVVAVPLGFAAGGAVYRPFVSRIGAQTDVAIPLVPLAGAVAAVVAVAALGAAVPSGRATRTRSTTVLRTGAAGRE